MTQLPYFIFLGLAHNVFFCEKAPFNDDKCTYEILREKQLTLDKCLDADPDVRDFSKTLMQPSGSILKFLDKRCSFKPQLDDCLDLWIDLITECIDPDDRKGVDVWKKIDTEVIDYVCSNRAEIVTKLFQDKRSCTQGGLSKALSTCSRYLTITAPFYDIPRVKQSCREIEDMERCLIDNLSRQCPPNVVELAKPIFHPIRSGLCN